MFTTIVLTGFAVAFLHAAIPTHWLPFVVAARAQRWDKAKTLAITGVAGAGHVLFTTGLGVLVVWGGIVVNRKFGNAFPLIAGGALIALGLFYLFRRVAGGHSHVHLLGSHSHHEHEPHSDTPHAVHSHSHPHVHSEDELEAIREDWSHRRSDWAAMIGLFALLTFSPCEAFLPVFLVGAKYGWFGFTLLSAILAIGTVAGMITFTWLTLIGIQRLRLKAMEKYESLIISGVFCGLGILIIALEH